MGSELRVTSLQREIQEFFIGVGGGPNFGSERTVELFCGKLLFPTPPPTSHWEGRDDYVFLNLWKPVAVGTGNTQMTEGTQRQSHFWIFLEFSLVAKYNTRFIKKSSQLNSDVQSYRYKDFSIKQLSGLGGDPDPPDHPPGSATALVPFNILSTAFGNSNTPITNSDKIKKCTAPLEQKQGKKLFFNFL